MSAEPFLPLKKSYPALSRAVQKCEGCGLYKHATQAVFGKGGRAPKIFFVGEQPGHYEDMQGDPFVGPSGKFLTSALEAAGVNMDTIYITNAVKHFKWSRSGKRRIHQKPNTVEIKACHPWLDAELQLLQPKIIVCLGKTAAESVFQKSIKVLQARSKFHQSAYSENTFITVHPSALIRIADPVVRKAQKEKFIEDLVLVKRKLQRLENA